MKRRGLGAAAPWSGAASGVALVAAVACGPIDEPAGSPAPVNACPQHACASYAQNPAPTCAPEGLCTTPVPSQGVVLVVSLSADGAFGPPAQYVVPYEHLGDCLSGATPTSAAGCDPSCVWPACGHLPAVATFQGGYLIAGAVQYPIGSPASATGVGFFLGNADSTGTPEDTLLPVTASYRLLEDPWGTDVTARGLPVQPVQGQAVINAGIPTPGPYGGPSFGYQVGLPPGTYERTVTPDAPYDAIFGPAISSDAVTVGQRFELPPIKEFDLTGENVFGSMTLPTFDISRSAPDGQPAALDGWTAYLRDATTLEVLSNVRPLSGTLSHIQLLTFHNATDALTNAELVVAPPTGAPYPTAVVVAAPQIPVAEPYPQLPGPVTVAVQVEQADGSPVDADLVFEGLGFTNVSGVFAFPSYEFTANASVRGGAPSSLTLPPGSYRVDVRPVDDSGLLVTTVTIDPGSSGAQLTYMLGARPTVRGKAALSDGRPLAGAVVEGLPASCAAPSTLPDPGPKGALKALVTSASCLPGPAQTITAADGSFSLPLDPGGFTLRVRPVQGTGFPWTAQPLQVVTADLEVDPVVPAPFHASFQLMDPTDKPIVNALVQAFYAPPAPPAPVASATAPAVELGDALTDGSGQVDLYMALPR